MDLLKKTAPLVLSLLATPLLAAPAKTNWTSTQPQTSEAKTETQLAQLKPYLPSWESPGSLVASAMAKEGSSTKLFYLRLAEQAQQLN